MSYDRWLEGAYDPNPGGNSPYAPEGCWGEDCEGCEDEDCPNHIDDDYEPDWDRIREERMYYPLEDPDPTC